jgi:ADP-ribose pyrophosphatase
VHLFLATELTPLAVRPEAHEVLEVHWLSFEEALRMARDGEIRDGKSLVGIFRAHARRRAA